MRVEAVDDDRIASVLRLYRAHASTLGFMPEGGFQSRAAKGTLLAAIETDGSTLGYILYDLPGRHIALRQLCIDDRFTGRGIARELVDDLEARHPQRLGILVRCRNDYPAAGFWPKADFEPLSEMRGRSLAGFPLTAWWRDFGHPTLFSMADDETAMRRRAALDTDVFLDLVADGDRPVESGYLQADWLQGLIDLLVTKEVAVEINNCGDARTRERHRSHLTSFTRRDAPTFVWEPIAKGLRTAIMAGGYAVTDHDERDIRHVARAAAVGAEYFLTRDADLIRRLAPISSGLGISVTTPAEYIARIALDAGEPYTPVQLAGTTFRLTSVAGYSVADLVRRFLNTASGERAAQFRQAIRDAIADQAATETLVIADHHGDPTALIVRRLIDDTLDVSLLRVAGPLASTISRHVAYLQRRHTVDKARALVRVTDRHLSPPVAAALTAEGYIFLANGWYAAPRQLMAPINTLSAALETESRRGLIPENVFAELQTGRVPSSIADDLERRHSPLKVVGAGISTYLVPIRADWAAQLFDSGLSEQTLFPRDEVLGISREHVYYSGALRSIRSPARLVWYVSGRGRPGTRSIRAVSRLEEAVIGRPGTLFRRYQHLGVWRRDQVEGAATRGRALALRFSDTELFRHPVPLADLRDQAERACHTLVLRSISEIPEHLFALIYERGMYGSD